MALALHQARLLGCFLVWDFSGMSPAFNGYVSMADSKWHITELHATTVLGAWLRLEDSSLALAQCCLISGMTAAVIACIALLGIALAHHADVKSDRVTAQ